MRDKKEHDDLIEKYYPDGCELDTNHVNPLFSDKTDSEEIKENNEKIFFEKIYGNK